MNLRTCYLTRNDCYRTGKVIVPRGVMVHSTGANNPNLRRYVGPDDGLLGPASSKAWNRPDTGACVHAFIGRLADGSVATYQTLPWNMRGWHCGRGSKGSANDTHISFEICEDGLEDASYFWAAYREAVQLTAYLCRRYKLDPLVSGVVICHSEGAERGLASNHADVMHWFAKHGATMTDFRRDVSAEMEEDMLLEKEIRAIVREEIKAAEAGRAALSPSPWAEALLLDARRLGLTDGSRPRSYATREEVALMVRAAVT